MTLSKGSWIGLIVAIFWVAVSLVWMRLCNFNWVCNGAMNSNFGCTTGGNIFFVPVYFVLSNFEAVFKTTGMTHPVLPLVLAVVIYLMLSLVLGDRIAHLPRPVQKILISSVLCMFAIISLYYLLIWVSHGFDPQFIQIDRCLDSGGSWVHGEYGGACQSHPLTK